MKQRIKYAFLLAFILCMVEVGFGQTNEALPKRMYINHTLVGISSLSLLDNYISDRPYQGVDLQLLNRCHSFVNSDHHDWSKRTDVAFNLGIASNESATAQIYYGAVNLGFGMQHHFKPMGPFQLLLGGIWDVDVAIRKSSKNSNNNINLDLSSNLNLATTCIYKLNLLNQSFRFLLDMRMPLLGVAMVPPRGASYYEIYMVNNFSDVVHFTSLNTKNALNTLFLVEIPIKNVQLDLGIQSDWMQYHVNRVFVKKNILSVQAGISYNFKLFGDRKY